MALHVMAHGPGRTLLPGTVTCSSSNKESAFLTHRPRSTPKMHAMNTIAPGRLSAGCMTRRARSSHSRRTTLIVFNAPASAVASPTNQKPPEIKVKVEDVTPVAVSPDIVCLRNTSTDRIKYEIEFSLKRGSTDNSYVIKGKAGSSILIDVPLEPYADSFAKSLPDTVDPSKISHIVLTHLAPNRLVALKNVLQLATANREEGSVLEVHLTNPALQLVQTSYGEDPEATPLLSKVIWVATRTGSTIKLPEGRKLQMILTPTPRWPDLMCVYDSTSKILFTSKIFSAHVAPGIVGGRESAFDVGGWQTYGRDWQYFFDCMFAPVARQAAAAFEKLDIVGVDAPPAALKVQGILSSWAAAFEKMVIRTTGVEEPAKSADNKLLVKALAPLHGPVIKTARNQLLNEYRDWIESQIKASSSSTIAVMYASAYGNTAALAQAVSRGITKGGVGVQTINLEVAALEEVAQAAREANGFIIGSPTLGGHMPTQVQAALGTVLKEPRAKGLPCGVFGSFGWSGEAVDELEGRLRNAGFSFAFQPIKVKFRPTAADLQRCEQSGRDLATKVKKQLKTKEKVTAGQVKEVAGSGAQLAMGRVIGSLCVVTAKDEDLTSAMLASWVSQASFDPPGLTISVKKDRAIENQMTIGSKFAVSILAEGSEKDAMKRLTRPFGPGEDRLAGLEVVEGPVTGSPLLKSAASALECQVVSRMEAGDHWIVYGQVLDGQVLNEGALSAVHYRKVGNHY